MENLSGPGLVRLTYLRTYADACNAKIAMMQCENKWRELQGESLAYGEDKFDQQFEKLENIAREMEKIR